MDAGLADHVVNERDVIDTLTQRRHHIAEHLAGCSIGSKPERRLHPRTEPVLKRFDVLTEVGGFSMLLLQQRLVIPQVDMAGGSGHEQLNNPFDPRGMMRCLQCCRICGLGIVMQYRSERKRAETVSGLRKKLTSVKHDVLFPGAEACWCGNVFWE